MAYTESDRVQIRTYLGFGAIYLQLDPRLESAITSSQATSDGGTRPDNSSELLAKGLVTKLQAVDAAIDALLGLMGTYEADGKDGAKIDAAREDARLRKVGRTYVYRLARIFDTEPRADCYAPAPIITDQQAGPPRRIGY